MRRLRCFALSVPVVLAMALAGAASACPVCASNDGLQIRAMLRERLWPNLAAVLAPAPVLIVLVGAVRLATPWLAGGRADAAARRDER